MEWIPFILIGVLVLAIAVCIIVKEYLKHRLDSIDGMVAIVKREEMGNVIRWNL